MDKPTRRIYEPAIDPKVVARWNAKRRGEHKVHELEEGFSFRASGRDGFIYFKEGDKIMELYWEMSGVPQYNILLSLAGLSEWALPSVVPIATEKQVEILAKLRGWLDANNIRAELSHAPAGLSIL
jgi:hypothetical protein